MGITGSGSLVNGTLLTQSLTALNSTFDVDCTGLSTVRLYISGTFTGIISFSSTTNGTDFDPRYAIDDSGAPTGNVASSTPDSFTAWYFNVVGISTLRFEMTSYTSGTADLAVLISSSVSVLQGITSTVTVSGAVMALDSGGHPFILGQTSMAQSLPVTLASNQPAISISAGSLPLPTGAATSALQTQPGVDIGDVTINNANLTNAVNIQDGGNSITVDGGVNATQTGTWNITAVQSITNVVHIDDNAGSLTVDNTGTFAVQATLAAETTKVIGTVNQGTNPWIINNAQINGVTPLMGNGISGTGAQRVTIASDSTGQVTLAAGVATIGALTANQSINNAQIAGVSTATGNGVVGTGVQRVAIASDNTAIPINNSQINGVTPLMGNGVTGTGSQRVTIASDNTAFSVNATGPTLTKGTQGATGFTVQELHDAGRNQSNLFMAIQIVSTSTDALLALTGYKSSAAVGATTTPAVVTTGKTFRIQNIVLSYVTIVTTSGSIRFTLRANTGGVVAIGSPAVANWTVGDASSGTPVAGEMTTINMDFPDGLEFAAGTGLGVSQVGINTIGVAAAVGYGIVTIMGYEY